MYINSRVSAYIFLVSVRVFASKEIASQYRREFTIAQISQLVSFSKRCTTADGGQQLKKGKNINEQAHISLLQERSELAFLVTPPFLGYWLFQI